MYSLHKLFYFIVMENLSGGERKRVNIACDLLADPAILLVDVRENA